MSISFGRFELDESARALRLDGRECPLQPLVFDLLVYLIQHRSRVVSKDELLTKLWSGAIVTDGSLQRAVSLLRTALREGGMDQAVQTFARRGYRFCEVPQTAGSAVTPGTALEGRRWIEQGQWQRAVDAFAASEKSSFSLEDWEAWGNAALCAGIPEASVAPFEHAVAAFDEAGERESAARVALLLTNVKLEARELAIAKGWHQRALGYLKGEPEGKQHGMAVWLEGRLALFEGELDRCAELARQALEIAERVRDPDLHVLGLIYQGHILIAHGEVRRGLSLHDEAGAAALAGRVSLWVSGIVFCSVIWVYLHLGDHHRAGQWTDQFGRWCERHGSFCYPALCRLHRSEILAMRGELDHAEVEVRRAREQLMVVGRYAEGDACRVLGEIRLSRGDLDGAESAFREAHRLGWNPQPGLGLLLAERGDLQGALKQLERALAQPTWADGQRRGVTLAVLARIAAIDGQLGRATAAIQELEAAPERTESRVSAAELAHARGELCWAQRDLPGAERHLRGAVTHWLEGGATVHAARLRLRLSEMLLAAGDPTAAELELGAAEATFAHVRADALLARCQALRDTAFGVESPELMGLRTGLTRIRRQRTKKPVIIRAFASYRPAPGQAAQVACPPSDVFSLDNARALAAANPTSFLHVSRPEVDLPPGAASYGEYRHRKAAANFRALVERGVLVEDPGPHLYVYAQRLGDHRQVGVVACVKVYDHAVGIRGGKSIPEEELDDRVHHIEHLRAHDEPVLLGYRGDSDIDWLVNMATGKPPACQFTTPDDVEHSVWVADFETRRGLSMRFDACTNRWEAVPRFYLLDGDRLRTAAIRAYRRQKGQLGGEDDVFLALLVPHDQVKVAPYDLLVRDREARSPEALIASMQGAFELAPAASGRAATPRRRRAFAFYLNGQWYAGQPRATDTRASDPLDALDFSICQNRLLFPIFGVRDPANDAALAASFRATEGTTELERRIDSGEFTLAIRLFPPAMDEILAVADADRSMPELSFSLPLKPCSGLFVHTF